MRFALLPLAGALVLGGCATPMAPPNRPEGVEHAVETPIRDLSLIREQAPAALTRAWAEPYRTRPDDSCASLGAELAELDAALGPDVGAADKASSVLDPAGLATGAVEGAVGLPFRGIVRTVSGAEQRDRSLHAAVTAGMIRRGFLKGRMLQMSCPAPAQPLTTPEIKGRP